MNFPSLAHCLNDTVGCASWRRDYCRQWRNGASAEHFMAISSSSCRRHCGHMLLFALESRAIKHFNFSRFYAHHFFAFLLPLKARSRSKKTSQSGGKMLCNFQQIEFLFYFDGDYSVTFSLLYCSLIFIFRPSKPYTDDLSLFHCH